MGLLVELETELDEDAEDVDELLVLATSELFGSAIGKKEEEEDPLDVLSERYNALCRRARNISMSLCNKLERREGE